MIWRGTRLSPGVEPPFRPDLKVKLDKTEARKGVFFVQPNYKVGYVPSCPCIFRHAQTYAIANLQQTAKQKPILSQLPVPLLSIVRRDGITVLSSLIIP